MLIRRTRDQIVVMLTPVVAIGFCVATALAKHDGAQPLDTASASVVRVALFSADQGSLDDYRGFIQSHLFPTLRAAPGYMGTLLGSDPKTRQLISLSFWRSDADVAAGEEAVGRAIRALPSGSAPRPSKVDKYVIEYRDQRDALASTVPTTIKHTVLIVLTHGDDDVSIAPLLAKYADAGHRIVYATFPGAQDQSAVEDSPARQELLCASRALGVSETFVTPSGSQGLTTRAEQAGFERRTAERVIELINKTKADVIVTWGPEGLTGHPLHITVGNIVTRVFQRQDLLTHKPGKLYYIAYPASRFPAVTPAAIGTLSEDLIGVPDAFISTKVNASQYLKQARAAVACHTTNRGGFASNEQWRAAWERHVAVTLDGVVFLRLALAASGGRETDIFEGL